MDDPFAGQYLARAGEIAETGGKIERFTPISVLDRQRFSGIEPDTDI
jgi:hypothetical protein